MTVILVALRANQEGGSLQQADHFKQKKNNLPFHSTREQAFKLLSSNKCPKVKAQINLKRAASYSRK